MNLEDKKAWQIERRERFTVSCEVEWRCEVDTVDLLAAYIQKASFIELTAIYKLAASSVSLTLRYMRTCETTPRL